MGQWGLDIEAAKRKVLRAPAVLLLLAEAPTHGYQLADRLRTLGLDVANIATVYHDLRALEAAGLVRSGLSLQGHGPVPRVYELTPAGTQSLDACAERLRILGELIVEFGERHAALGASKRAERKSRRARNV